MCFPKLVFQLQQKPTGDFRLKVHGAFESANTLLLNELDNETMSYSYLTVQPQISYDMAGNQSRVYKVRFHKTSWHC